MKDRPNFQDLRGLTMSSNIIMLVLLIMAVSLLLIVFIETSVDVAGECIRRVHDFCLNETDSDEELMMCMNYWSERECHVNFMKVIG